MYTYVCMYVCVCVCVCIYIFCKEFAQAATVVAVFKKEIEKKNLLN